VSEVRLRNIGKKQRPPNFGKTLFRLEGARVTPARR
jgi:hypothetical protein